MATRAVIKIEGVNFAQIYKHWDGYPEATLPWLEAFNSSFERKEVMIQHISLPNYLEIPLYLKRNFD